MSADGATKATAAEALEKLAWERYTAGDNQSIATDVAEAGTTPLLGGLLRGILEEIRGRFILIASGELENFTIANPALVAGVVEAGAIPRLVKLLSHEMARGLSGSDKGKQYVASKLGNLANDSDANRAAVAKAGALPLLVELLSNGSNMTRSGRRPRQCGGRRGGGGALAAGG